jgi:stage IV sporulation protein FB
MIRIPGKIPISIHPTFWLVSALIGFLYSGHLIGTVIWIGIIFVSVLFHEMGHALTALAFGLRPRIELVAMGGLTYHEGDKLSGWKRFFIVFNGPLFGFILFLIATACVQLSFIQNTQIASIIALVQVVNLFWTLINLIPVLPLDGGQLLRVVLESFFGVKGFRYTLIIGAVISLCISLFSFINQQFFIGALFFLFAFQGYDSFRKSRFMSEPDQKESIKASLLKAEGLLAAGNKAEAQTAFEMLRKEAKQGLIYNMATQYLAFLENENGNTLRTYQLLKEVRSDLAPDALCLLHRVSFEEKDYKLAKEIASETFQYHPTVDTALRNAYIHGILNEPDAAIGWLDTAVREGLQNIQEVSSLPFFDSIRNAPAFIDWQQRHH